MSALLFAAIAFSGVILVLLCIGDPKRRRSAHLSGAPQGSLPRRLLTMAALCPGGAYALSGDPSAFLLWLGSCAVIGWLVALVFAGLSQSPRS